MLDSSQRRVGRLDRAKADLMDRALAHARRCTGDDPERAELLAELIGQYWRRVPAEDILGRDPADLDGAAASQLEFGWRRPRGTALVRVVSPSEESAGWSCPHSVVEIITDDMPFLVDSVTAELNRAGYAIHLVVHPQLRVRRDAVGEFVALGNGPDCVVESWMHVEIDRHSDVTEFADLRRNLRSVLEDVRAVVEDFDRMKARAGDAIADLRAGVPAITASEVDETIAFLEWLADNNFTFLGYREYELTGEGGAAVLRTVPATGLGILRDAGLQPESRSFTELSPQARAKVFEPNLLTLTQANSRATVHRPAYLDYVGIKRLDPAGIPLGERRFLGLFGLNAYTVSVTTIPVVRHKVAAVFERAALSPDSHDAHDLMQILETYPREELFAISVDDLFEIATGILGLQERRHVRLFVRRDDYGRFFSCLVFLPRERYTTDVRLSLQSILLDALHGTSVDYSTRLSESVLARLHFVIRVTDVTDVAVDFDELEERLTAATRSWEDELADAVYETFGEERGTELLQRYADAFPEAYKEDFAPRVAVADIRRLESLTDESVLDLSLYKPQGAPPGVRRFKISRVGPPLSLSDLMPKLQDMGVEVTDERPYTITRAGAVGAWVYDFGLRHAEEEDFDADGVREAFQEAFAAVWAGRMESDALNALVLGAGVSWREVVLLRAYGAYLRQIGSTFSQSYIATALTRHVGIVRLLVDLFEARFDPRLSDYRDAEQGVLIMQVLEALDDVSSLDEDRILRSFLGLIRATLRTNHYQRAADGSLPAYLVLKLDPQEVPELPAPRPEYEIFVHSPRFEGVHLRFGPVARGGLRWSDRREDFRTEVLGLVKAQTVKNAVIVPVGAKGGFVVKRPGDDGQAIYSLFINALLCVTDNLVDGAVVPPVDVVRHDGDDPYLVVAADKGTATFSDIANAIALERGFWLGDAFASGGSTGYDHKRMGITARGAWESVKRHFRELGIDIQSQDFTVVGIGDMSGDVFGNGMLLSPHIRLVAAFDHRHVFVDPDPDAATSYAERRRLFDLPRSSWADYDTSLISAGGGVWPRAAKSVPLTAEVRRRLGVDAESLTPAELIRAILRAPVDLLWNGGIGTYVKATAETNADVGDKTNDVVRVNADELRARVVGEGGNLGLTHRSRIEFARRGGLIYTDAIDNSAGVDTSDHEVNIKILLDDAVKTGDLTRKQRDELLQEMTDEVASLVLRDNYEQTVALGNSVAEAASLLHVHARFIDTLVAAKGLDRELEFLPSQEEIARRMSVGEGLTAPEFAVLLAYRKITLTKELVASTLPDDPNFTRALVDYFPMPLREKYQQRMRDHRLHREIIATSTVNHMVNRAGISFVTRVAEETGATTVDVVRAHNAAWRIYQMGRLWLAIEGLDNRVPTRVQTEMFLAARQLVERASRFLLHSRRPPLDVQALVDYFGPGVEAVAAKLTSLLSGADRLGFDRRRNELVAEGVPGDLAEQVALLAYHYSAHDIVDVAATTERPVDEVAQVYFAVEDQLDLGRLRDLVNALPRDDRWHTLARAALRDDLYAAQAALTGEILESTDPAGPPAERVDAWIAANAGSVRRAATVLAEITGVEHADLATLSVALRELRAVIRSSKTG